MPCLLGKSQILLCLKIRESGGSEGSKPRMGDERTREVNYINCKKSGYFKVNT